MSYPPPPPDRAHVPQAQPMSGPGGAYGPPPASTAPLPGQLPQVTMPKPGTVTGVQVILWIFSAIAAIGDLFSIIGLVNYFSPLGLLALLVALYFTVQSLVSPIYIERGKRWAWIWSVVSAFLGLGFAVVSIAVTLTSRQFFAGPVLISVVIGALYALLAALLLSPSAKSWILMHRIQRGEVAAPVAPAPGGPGPVPDAMPGAPEPARPERKPGVVTTLQVIFALLVIPVLLVIPELIEDFQHEADIWDYDSLHAYVNAHNMWPAFIAAGIGGLIIILVHAVIIRGLGKGRVWARVFGAIWLGITLLPWGLGAVTMWALVVQRQDSTMSVDGVWVDDPFEPFWLPISAWALSVGVVLVIVSFILLMVRGTREWTPGKPPIIVVTHQQR